MVSGDFEVAQSSTDVERAEFRLKRAEYKQTRLIVACMEKTKWVYVLFLVDGAKARPTAQWSECRMCSAETVTWGDLPSAQDRTAMPMVASKRPIEQKRFIDRTLKERGLTPTIPAEPEYLRSYRLEKEAMELALKKIDAKPRKRARR